MYSANNTPYSALMGVMTPDVSERTGIASYRFVAALFGQFLIQGLALPLVDKFGHGDSARGWTITMAIFASLIVIFNLITFASTKERVLPDPKQKSSFSDDLRDVFTCRPWLLMFILTLLVFTTLVLRGGSLNYYFSYYLDQENIKSFLNGIGLGATSSGEVTGWKAALNEFGLIVKPDNSNASSVGYSLFSVCGSLIQIVGILFSKPLADRFGKKAVFIFGMSVSTLATALVFIAPPTSIGLVFGLGLLWGLGWGPTVPLLWVMIADVADFSEWKHNRRATGFMYAGILFALKAGLGLGGALSGWLLDSYGYVPNVAQSPHAMLGIRLCSSLYSAIPFAVGLLCLALYPIGKELNLRIQGELADRRKRLAPV
jgi:Na+/melibiose symporter-like transporter